MWLNPLAKLSAENARRCSYSWAGCPSAPSWRAYSQDMNLGSVRGGGDLQLADAVCGPEREREREREWGYRLRSA